MPTVTCPQCNKSQEPQDASFLDFGWGLGKLMINPARGFFEFGKGLYEFISRDHICTRLCSCRYCNTLFTTCPHCFKTQIINDVYETLKTQKCLHCHREFQTAMDGDLVEQK